MPVKLNGKVYDWTAEECQLAGTKQEHLSSLGQGRAVT